MVMILQEPRCAVTLAKPSRAIVAGIPVDRMAMDEAVQWIVRELHDRSRRSPLLIMGPNAQLVTLAHTNPRFRQALCRTDLNVPDGISVVLASRLLGAPVPERVTGGDLMERLCRESARCGFRVFFLGGLPGAAEGAATQLAHRYPGLRVTGCYCPERGFENDPEELAAIRQMIAEHAPDLLCVAFGAPKQEIWMHENCPSLPIGAAIAVGAAFDTCAGLRRRAPRWTHKVGLEWLYRLCREPRRLWRRYLIGNSQFIALIAAQMVRELFAPAFASQPANVAGLTRKGR